MKRIRADKGIPTPDGVIREYIDTHPDENNWQASQKLGVSQNTVAKVRDFQKREVPVFENPALETAHNNAMTSNFAGLRKTTSTPAEATQQTGAQFFPVRIGFPPLSLR